MKKAVLFDVARRRSLKALAAGGALVAGGARAVPLEAATSSAREARLAGLGIDTANAAALGCGWLQEHPDEADAGALRRHLGLPDRKPLRREALSVQVVEDFSRGEVTRLGGWVLSLTEARLCALYYLEGGA